MAAVPAKPLLSLCFLQSQITDFCLCFELVFEA